MKYSDAIARAFRALRSGGLWGFAVTVSAAALVLIAGLAAVAYAVAGPRIEALIDMASGSGTRVPGVGQALAASAGLVLGLILALPLALIYHGGLVHLSDDALAGRATHVGAGWSFGTRRMGRTFAVDFAAGAILFVVLLLAILPVILAFVAIGAASPSSAASDIVAVGGVCFGYLLFIVVVLGASLVVSAWESLSIRYALIGGRTSGDALGSGWRAFRARWKSVVLFALILLGMQYGYAFVTSIVLVPIEFVTMPHAFFSAGQGDPAQVLPEMLRAYAVILPVAMVINVPWFVFFHNLWTAFFRQMTGLDVPPEPAFAYVPYPPTQPAPPAPPSPPTLPGQPTAPATSPGPPMAPTTPPSAESPHA